jgi:hypothetical protein
LKDHEKNIGQTTDTPRGNGTRSAGFRGGFAGNTPGRKRRNRLLASDKTKHHIAGTINLRVLRALRGNIKMLSFQINKV